MAKVRFFVHGDLIGEDTTAPYGMALDDVYAGTYSLTAEAVDSSGDATLTPPVVVTVTGAAGGGTGTILREYWSGIPGAAVSDLTSHPNYPNSPTGGSALTSFEGTVNPPGTFGEDQYGASVRGFVHPPVIGFYRSDLLHDRRPWRQTTVHPPTKLGRYWAGVPTE